MTILSTFKDRSSKLTVGGALALVLTATGCQSSAESNTAITNQSNGHSSTPTVSDISQQTLKQQARAEYVRLAA